MKTIQLLLLCLLALVGFGTNTAQAQEPRFAGGQTFMLRISGVPGVDLQQVSGSYTISSGGTIRLPYLNGEISATGLTPTELQRKIEAAYKSGEIYTHPTINIITNNAMTTEMLVTVGGEVRQPGDVPFRPGINLYSAITKCGGPTEYGDMKRVKLLRGKSEKVYDLRKIGNDNNPELLAGDQVVVPGS
jgi:protein involved in polysaccharide export with SLBB domain